MIIPCQVHVVTSSDQLRQALAIYTVKDAESVVQYVGVAPLAELFQMPDAQRNSLWAETFGAPFIVMEIEVVGITIDEREAYNEQRKLIAKHAAICNRKGYQVPPAKQKVKCIETGEIFESAKACAEAHNLTYSALYMHLKRKPGHRSVKGKTYMRTMEQ